jgi:transposase
MASIYGTEFRREAVRLALTSSLTRKQIAADLGIGFSTLSKRVQQDQDELDIFAELTETTNEDTVVNSLREMIQRTFGLALRVRIGINGDIAKAFEGAFKPVRIQDLR